MSGRSTRPLSHDSGRHGPAPAPCLEYLTGGTLPSVETSRCAPRPSHRGRTHRLGHDVPGHRPLNSRRPTALRRHGARPACRPPFARVRRRCPAATGGGGHRAGPVPSAVLFPLIFLARLRAAGGLASTLQATSPFAVMARAWLVIRERPCVVRIAAVVGLVGVALLVLRAPALSASLWIAAASARLPCRRSGS